MDVVRRHRRGPEQAGVVVVLLDDRRDRAGDTDAVGPHRDADRLAVGTERIESERVGELAPQLEDVADLDPARDRQLAAVARAPVTVTDLDRTDLAVDLEVA